MKYALHCTAGKAADNEMYLWFTADGIYYIEGRDNDEWSDKKRLGHSTPDMTDYEHMDWALKPDYSKDIRRVSFREVERRLR